MFDSTYNAVTDEAFDRMAQVEFYTGVAQVLNMRLCIVIVAPMEMFGRNECMTS